MQKTRIASIGNQRRRLCPGSEGKAYAEVYAEVGIVAGLHSVMLGLEVVSAWLTVERQILKVICANAVEQRAEIP